jgi:hypothetical protein
MSLQLFRRLNAAIEIQHPNNSIKRCFQIISGIALAFSVLYSLLLIVWLLMTMPLLMSFDKGIELTHLVIVPAWLLYPVVVAKSSLFNFRLLLQGKVIQALLAANAPAFYILAVSIAIGLMTGTPFHEIFSI